MTGPYRWDDEQPELLLPRAGFSALAELLGEGKRAMVHAGHGMGKSVLLRWLEAELSRRGLRVVRLAAPEGEPLADALRRALAPEAAHLRAAVAAACASHQIAVLIDEADAWISGAQEQPTSQALSLLDKASRGEQHGRLGVLVAGGLGPLLLARSPWGSPFASRVESTTFLRPLDAAELGRLAEPLRARRTGDTTAELEGWLDELRLASGGVPALAARGLEMAWEQPLDRPLDRPTEALSRWLTAQRGFRASVRSSIRVGERDHAWRLLERVRAAADGEVPIDELRDLSPPDSTPEELLELLVSAGLIHPDLDLEADPALVRPNPSVLLGERPQTPRRGPPLDRLFADLQAAAGELSLHRADLRVGSKERRDLVPEALFAAVLSIALSARGWQVHREAQRGEGRTDLLIRGPRLGGHVIVEVKRWGNQDLPRLEAQLAGYLTAAPAFSEDDQTIAVAAVVVAGPSLDAAALAEKLPGLCATPAETLGPLRAWSGTLPCAGREALPLRTLAVTGLFAGAGT